MSQTLPQYLGAVFTAFAEHLRDTVPTRSQDIISKTYDPTYGERECTETVETIDLHQLCIEIDNFATKLALELVPPKE